MVCPRSCSSCSILQLVVFHITSCSSCYQRCFCLYSRCCSPCTDLFIRISCWAYTNVNTSIVICIHYINRCYRASYYPTAVTHYYIVISSACSCSNRSIAILVAAHSSTSSGAAHSIFIPLVAKCAITCSSYLQSCSSRTFTIVRGVSYRLCINGQSTIYR